MKSIDKQPVCAICGTYTNLSQHHIVPQRYLRHFKNRCVSEFNPIFLLNLCRNCHDVYETKAISFEQDIEKKYLSAHEQIIKRKYFLYQNFLSAKLSNEKDNIKKAYQKKFNHDMLTDKDLEDYCEPSKLIVNRLTEKEISRLWINHFLKKSKCKYLSLDERLIFHGEWENFFHEDTLKTTH